MKRVKMFFRSAKRKVVTAAAVAALGATQAHAALGDGFTVDTAPVLAVANIIIIAIGGIWAVKKVIALSNKS